MFVVDPADGSKFWVRVREGKLAEEGEELPYAGRVDVQVAGGPKIEVKWLRLITAEVDHVSISLCVIPHTHTLTFILSLLPSC